MLFKYFFDEQLAHASYMVGCPISREVVVVDPVRNITPYLSFAEKEDLKIVGVLETELHTNFISGAKEIAVQFGAQIYIPGEGDVTWTYPITENLPYQLLKNGDVVEIGKIIFEVLHTPGHTPESISILVTDQTRSTEPIGIFTGNFVLVGDIGLPQTLETTSRIKGLALNLFKSLQRFKQLPEYLQIWPSYSSRDTAGKENGFVPFSTVGYEKRFNWAMRIEDEREFIEEVLTNYKVAPPYFAYIKQINQDGPSLTDKRRTINEIKDVRILEDLIEFGAQVVDTRSAESFTNAYIEGSINIPFDQSFSKWAGWLIDFNRPLYLICDRDKIDEVLIALQSIGIDRAEAYIDADVAISNTFKLVANETIGIPKAEELIAKRSAMILNVGNEQKSLAEEVEGRQPIMLGKLSQHIDLIPTDKPLIIASQSREQTSIAASLLRAHGIRQVYRLSSGYHNKFKEKRKNVV